jgi:hypothetical protein
MLVKGRPMIDYKNKSKLLHFVDVKNFPKTHWSNIVGWEMTTCMHVLVVNKTKSLFEDARLIFLSYDEVTTFDQYS